MLDEHRQCNEAAVWCMLQEIGFCHMRIEDGVNSRLQLSGLLAKLCNKQLQSQG